MTDKLKDKDIKKLKQVREKLVKEQTIITKDGNVKNT